VQAPEQLGESVVLGCAGKLAVKCAIEKHQFLDIAQRRPVPRLGEGVFERRDVGVAGTFRREPRAVDFVDDAGLGDLKDLVEAKRPYHRALVRNDVDHPLQREALERLMDGGAADCEHGGKLQLVEVLARLQRAGDDAQLDGLVCLPPQGGGMHRGGARDAAINVLGRRHGFHRMFDGRLVDYVAPGTSTNPSRAETGRGRRLARPPVGWQLARDARIA
jgi:hypothetical protein